MAGDSSFHGNSGNASGTRIAGGRVRASRELSNSPNAQRKSQSRSGYRRRLISALSLSLFFKRRREQPALVDRSVATIARDYRARRGRNARMRRFLIRIRDVLSKGRDRARSSLALDKFHFTSFFLSRAEQSSQCPLSRVGIINSLRRSLWHRNR